jgi:hypothetical protein
MQIKKLILLSTVFILIFSSCKKVRNERMTVIKDCTGTYLRFNKKDYCVCNKEMTAAFADGTEVTATFKKIKTCSDDGIVCLTVHPYESYIEIEKIK